MKNILFLGNSYTAVNNLPDKLSKLAFSLGDSVYFDSNTPGGSRLIDHATNAITLDKISVGLCRYTGAKPGTFFVSFTTCN